jgi:hypothetical protein
VNLELVKDFFAIIGVLAVLFSVAFVAMGWWEDRQLDKQAAQDDDFVPLPRLMTPRVPLQPRPDDDALSDPNPAPPRDPAS